MIAVLHSPLSYPYILIAYGAASAAIVFGTLSISSKYQRVFVGVLASVLMLLHFFVSPRCGVSAPVLLYLVALAPLAWVDAERAQIPTVPALLAFVAGIAMFGSHADVGLAWFILAMIAAIVVAFFRDFRAGIGFGDVLVIVSLGVLAPGVTAAAVVTCALLVGRFVRLSAGSAYTASVVSIGAVAFLSAPHAWNVAPAPLAMVVR